MNPKHVKKIRAIQEKLVELYLVEADPDHWPTAEKIQAEIRTALERGEIEREQAAGELQERLKGLAGLRYWLKKNANQTASMVLRAETLAAGTGEGEGDAAPSETREIARMEKEVEKRITSRTRPQLVVNNGKG